MPTKVIDYGSMALSWKATAVVGLLTIVGAIFLLFSPYRWTAIVLAVGGTALVIFALRQIRAVNARWDEHNARFHEKCKQ